MQATHCHPPPCRLMTHRFASASAIYGGGETNSYASIYHYTTHPKHKTTFKKLSDGRILFFFASLFFSGHWNVPILSYTYN
uniref:Uncharacterized protein n=1 Tax=unidentified TaxID=32644 RepID=A0A6G9W378_9ZZZZ|nr:hypothetical protein [unidentified]